MNAEHSPALAQEVVQAVALRTYAGSREESATATGVVGSVGNHRIAEPLFYGGFWNILYFPYSGLSGSKRKTKNTNAKVKKHNVYMFTFKNIETFLNDFKVSSLKGPRLSAPVAVLPHLHPPGRRGAWRVQGFRV